MGDVILTQVDPETLVKPGNTGRGAWNKRGIGFDYRYAVSPDPREWIGTLAEKSLDHWAVAAGSWAIQQILVAQGHMGAVGGSERGIFGPRTKAGVEAFQRVTKDPKSGRGLVVDGTFGKTDARAMFVPMIDATENRYGIPHRLLLGQTMHESLLDPGCVGHFIYYGDAQEYRGVDRAMSQINSRANAQVSWIEAFTPQFAFNWSAQRLRAYFDRYRREHPKQPVAVLWDAAVCAHNNPSAANRWARDGKAPTEAAAAYVAKVKSAATL